MKNANPRNTSELEIRPFDSTEKKTDGRKKGKGKAKEGTGKRATWDDDRRKIHVLVAYRDFRPYGVPHGQVTKQWLAMTKAVNEKAPDSQPFAKQTVIDQLNYLMDQYKPTFSAEENSKSSGAVRFGSELEREAYKTWQLVRYYSQTLIDI
ncbi:hypothetical protein ABG067_008775 [Albugo candida]